MEFSPRLKRVSTRHGSAPDSPPATNGNRSQRTGKAKYIVCNADESEPGTIKDRFIMESVPHLVIEGMIVAGLVTGAQQGILYIRHEYEEPKDVLQEEIDRCYHAGLLGKKILAAT